MRFFVHERRREYLWTNSLKIIHTQRRRYIFLHKLCIKKKICLPRDLYRLSLSDALILANIKVRITQYYAYIVYWNPICHPKKWAYIQGMEGEGLGTTNNHMKKKKINIFKG
jgi:hypothetical protein